MSEQDFLNILKQYGNLISDKKRFTAIIRDFFPEQNKERNIVILSYQMGLAAEIYDADVLDDIFVYRYAKRLMNEQGINKDDAEWVVRLWCTCYGCKFLNKNCNGKLLNIHNENKQTNQSLSAENTDIEIHEDKFGRFEYVPSKLDENSLAIKKCKRGQEILIIPNIYKGKKVIEIGQYAFYENKVIQKVIISEGIQCISENAFDECVNLKEIEFPNSLKSIKFYAFRFCLSLESLMLPDNMEEIGYLAFCGARMKKIKFPKSKVRYEKSAFANCDGIESITIPGRIGMAFDEFFSGCEVLKQVTIEEGITEIGVEAFFECFKLEHVSLPESLEIIRAEAFCDCPCLNRIRIPDSVKEIECGAFDEDVITIECSAGSVAEEYAKEFGIKYDLTNR